MVSRIIVVLLFIAFCSAVFAHDMNIGIYEVGKTKKGKASLSIRLDKDDLLRELYRECENPNLVNDCLESYTNKHFELSFDNEQVVFEIQEIQHGQDVVEIKLVSSTDLPPFSTIELFTDCLLTAKPSQENIVRFSFNGTKRSFRLNKDLTKTTVIYKTTIE